MQGNHEDCVIDTPGRAEAITLSALAKPLLRRLATFSVVRSPYEGRIRRIKWLGQGTDGLLSAEITLMVRTGATVPEQFDGVPGNPYRASYRAVL